MAEENQNQLNSDELKVVKALMDAHDSFEFDVGSKTLNIMLGGGDIGANFANVRNDLIKDYLKDLLLDQFKERFIEGLDRILVNKQSLSDFISNKANDDVSIGDVLRDKMADDDMDIFSEAANDEEDDLLSPVSNSASEPSTFIEKSTNLKDKVLKAPGVAQPAISSAAGQAVDGSSQIMFDPSAIIKGPAKLLGDVVSLPFKGTASVVDKLSSWRDGTPGASIEVAVRNTELLEKAIVAFKANPKVSVLMDELNRTGDMGNLAKLIQSDPDVRDLWRNANNSLGSVASLWRKAARSNAREGKDITALSDEQLDKIKKIAKNIPHKFDMNGVVKSTFAESMQALMDRIANIIKALFKKKNQSSMSMS